MSARATIREALATALPEYHVTGNRKPDRIVKPTLLVWQSAVRQGPTLRAHGRYLVELTVWLLVAPESADTADDELDAALDDVLVAVAGIAGLVLDEAVRARLDTAHGYKITAGVYASIKPTPAEEN